MPITLNGSCHCGAVVFSVESSTAVPFMLCACSICRKVAGYNGSVNLGAHFETLKIYKGQESISVYQAIINRGTPEEKRATSERSFCSKCSTMLWLWDKYWPELCHPFASAIDSPLESPEEIVCIMNSSKPGYVRWPEGKKQVFEEYPELSIEDWHKQHGSFNP